VNNLARNVSTRYLALIIDAVIGLLVLPYTVAHLGKSAYGLWALTTSVTTYFTALQLGYGGALIKFVAEFRAKRDPRALNEVLSTMFFVYSAIGTLAYTIALVVAFFLPHLFHLDPGQARIGQMVLLITAAQIALYFPFSVFGGVINGFEQFYVNNIVGTVSNVLAAVAQVTVLWAGYGLVELVTATTIVRTVPFLVYRWNAYRAFPQMRIRFSSYRQDRLRDLTGFSIYLAIIDWSSKLAYATDSFVVGALLNTAAVGIFAIGSRLTEQMFKVTNQLHTLLFPAVVHRAARGETGGQQALMVKATRFQLGIAVAVAATTAADGDVLIRALFGPVFASDPTGFQSSVLVLQLLAFAVVMRAWMAMPSTVLKGTGHQRYVATVAAVAAVANALLSVVLVKLMGLTGSAMGTVIPATVLASAFVFPRACRVVQISTLSGYRRIVWPAAWPAAIVITLLALTRSVLPVWATHSTIVRATPVLLHMGIGALCYLAIFLALGIEREERAWIAAAITRLRTRRRAASLVTA
jgi:O-antigen/teichoic acid export membrane protein